MRRNLLRTIALLTAATIAIPAPAQTDVDPPKTGMIRLVSGQYLDISKPRRVGGMDYVDSIVYRPGTHRIATVSHRVVDGHFKCEIQLVQGDNGSKDTLVSSSIGFQALYQQMPHEVSEKVTQEQLNHASSVLEANWDLAPAVYTPEGWSNDGQYLIADFLDIRDPENLSRPIVIDALNDPPAVRDIAVEGYTLGTPLWSPDHTRIAFNAQITSPIQDAASVLNGQSNQDDAPKRLLVLYDPATTRVTKVVPKGSFWGWLDNDTVLFRVHVDKGVKHFIARKITTGTEQKLSVNDIATMSKGQDVPDNACPTHPELVSQFVDKTITEASDTQVVHSLWLKQISDQGVLSSVAIAAAGRAQDKSTPQVAWASDGKQFAYVLGGDLYVVDVIDHQPTDEERLAAGEDLPCDQIQRIAMTRMKQIGLGLLEYSQDYDEKFPPAANVDDVISPYMKTRDTYNVGRYHWTYIAPKDLNLAKIDSPATTPLGRIDLPCGPVILYVDGHVKVGEGKSEGAPGTGNDPN